MANEQPSPQNATVSEPALADGQSQSCTSSNANSDGPHLDLENRLAPASSGKSRRDPDCVEWDGPEDPEHPQNWPVWKKTWATFDLALLNLVFTIDSSILGSGNALMAAEFGVSQEVTILGVSLFLLGFTVGPPIWGPLSEKFGRRIPLVTGVAVASIFTIMIAVAKNMATVLVGRFLAGAFGIAPVAILGGSLTDTWNALSRGPALSACMSMMFCGPLIAPVIGGFITSSDLGWRWTMWLIVILGAFVSLLSLLALPETYPPVLLARRAARLRRSTGNSALYCAHEREDKSLGTLARVYLVRPWVLFFTEPILVLITLYHAFIFGLVYLFSQSYNIAFEGVRGWSHNTGSLPLLSLCVGVAIGLTGLIIHTKVVLQPRVIRNGGSIVPEWRLPVMIVGGVLLPIGLFWFAWTSAPTIPWPSMVCAGIPIGCGLYIIFAQCFSYIIDVYSTTANSALASNTFVRSLWAAGFPLFAPAMYHNLGIAWATSLLAFLSILMVPMPVLFYLYGDRVRKWSKNGKS